jgi:hypothetical protein
MPYSIRKVPKKSCYRVTNKRSKRVLAKCTTMKKAKKQIRLLTAIDMNPNFVLRNRVNKTQKNRKNK